MDKKITDGLRLSPQQEHLWKLQARGRGGPYRAQCAVRIEGALDKETLKAALRNVVARYEILRTTFHHAPGGTAAARVLSEVAGVAVEECDLGGAGGREAAIESLSAEAMRAPADLARGPLLHATLAKLSTQSHVLIITLPALCADAASLDILTREIARAYSACSRGLRLDDEPMQYADLAEWQNELLESEETEAGRAFWRKNPGLLPVNHPFENQCGEEAGFEYRSHRLRIAPETSAKVEAFAVRGNTTPEMFFLACWVTLLWRLTGQPEVAVTLASDGRRYEELRDAFGPLTKYLPVRCRPEDGAGFGEILAGLEGQVGDARKRQEYFTWELIAGAAGGGPKATEPPYSFEFVGRGERHSAAGVSFTACEHFACVDSFKVKLSCAQAEDSFVADFHFDPGLFTPADIGCMAGQFEALVESVLSETDTAVGNLSILGAAELRRVLHDFNDTAKPFPADVCVHRLFESCAEMHPRAAAVACKGGQLTYAELNARANQLAHHLRRLGVGPEVPVAVCVERSPEMVVGVLGILKAGGAYLPLDPAYPAEHLEFTLEDAQVPVIITQEHLAKRLPAHWAYVICLDADWGAIARESEENPEGGAEAEHLAYIIYTSGSAGKPKGVEVSHAALLNLVHWHQRAYGLTPSARATQLASPAFDASVWELWPYLCCGASVHFPDEEVRLSPPALIRWLAEQSVNVCFLPTPLAEAVLRETWPAATSLRTLLTGGDKLNHAPPSDAPFELVNHYGPTENTVVSTCAAVAREGARRKTPPIGRPIANTRAYVLDREMRPVPIGVPGELYVAGAQLARGYLNRPSLTAERFVPDPFSSEPGARLYKTGDLVRYLPVGEIEFLGRIDQQVKVRGFRIELGEIEAALLSHPLVRECAVAAREEASGDKRLAAYVVVEPGRQVSFGELRAFLKERLPDYMVPTAWVRLERLPLTPNGKVDRRALPEPEQSRRESEKSYVAPRTRTEEVLAEIWAEVLGVERVGVDDNFFELGGDSIIAIQANARAAQAGIQLNTKQLFQYQTIAELAPVAETVRAVVSEQGLVTGDVPLTPIQHWFFEQGFDSQHRFNQSVLLRLRRELAPGLLCEALRHLLMHHDALRLRFVKTPGGWRQHNEGFDEGACVPFSVIDLSHTPEHELAGALELACEQAQASLDLEGGLLFRAVLFDTGAGREGRLLIVAHHLVVDGVSWRVLLEDLQLVYEQLSRGEAVRLGAKTTSFKEWAERLAEYARGEQVRQEADFWLDPRRLEVKPLPSDYPHADGGPESVETVTASLNESGTHALLREVPAAYRVQINEALLAALVRTLCRWSGQPRVLVGVEGHGRVEFLPGVDVSRTVGWFTALYPVLLGTAEVDGGQGEARGQGARRMAGVLREVKEQLRGVPQQGVGYGLLRYLSGDAETRRTLEAMPAPELIFNYLGQTDQSVAVGGAFALADESSGQAQSAAGRRPYALEVNSVVAGGRLQVGWRYSRDAYRRETIEGLAAEMLAATRELIEESARPEEAAADAYAPSDFPLAQLSQEELDNLITEMNL